MNDKEIIQIPKDNPIKIIKCGDIEIPVEYLRQTTINVNGDDYIRVQQENQQLKEEIEEYKNPIKYFKYANKNVTEENKQLKEQLLVAQTNEETFRLEMKDITQTLGLDEDTLFDDVKVYVRSLKDNWNKLKEIMKEETREYWNTNILEIMQELEQGSDSNENN